MDSPDLQFKYQKLAFEYSKLRAQNQVLKRGVKDEQEKALQLKEDINSRDQSLRKAEQELDSLSFRNQQLTKRLSLLQEDVEIIKNKVKKGGAKIESAHSNYFNESNVYAEELESKIQENARLHAELRDLETFYKNKISELEDKIEEVSRNATKRPESIYSKDQPVKSVKDSLDEKSISSGEKCQQGDTKSAFGTRLKTFTTLENKNSLLPLRTLIKSQVNDSVIESLDGKPSRKIMLVDLVEPVKELSLGFIGLLTSYLPLLKKLSPSSAPYLKVNEELSQENSAWKEFSNIFEEVISANSKWDAASFSNLSGLSSLYGSVIKCSTSVQKINSLSEKCFCLRDIQMEAAWKKSLSSLTFCFTSVIPYVSVLSTFSNDCISVPLITLKKILFLLQERMSRLVTTSSELLNVWSLLTIEEKHESIKNSLIKIHKAFCKINSFLETISLKDSSPDSISLSSTMAQSPGTPHPPYSTSATNAAYVDNSFVFGCLQENLNSSSTENSLVQQLSQATRRLAKLEEEREHWKLECQLLSHRLNKENREINEDQSGVAAKFNSENSEQLVKTQGSVINTSFVGEVQVSICSAEEREKQIRDHFTNRCSQLFMQLTSCISQAALYQNECENLLHCLAISEDAKSLVEKEVEVQRREKAQIQEALSTTSRNYEEQISAMSDHIADMNEKITLQAETIEQLSFQLKKKNFK
ncbi:UNVERIFIED_CONTAM: hypothetical protein RMT77_004185 [Armadillidium vulgare]